MIRRLLTTLTFLAAIAQPQTYTGSIGGTVLDAQGLPVPNAAVIVTEDATNVALKTLTNPAGGYIVTYLKPGTYRVSFQAAGFKERIESGIQLQINQQRRVDPVLELGQVTEQVQVSASTAQINYVSPEIGQVVDADQLLNLPELASNSRGRSPFLLAKLLPGVTTNGNSYSNINGFSFAGGRRLTNEILVDGLPTTNPSDQTYTLTPSPESIQEFKVLTTPFSAEYGHTGGGVMIATSRGGTNQLHGLAFDLFRNRILNTRDFFAATQSTTKYVQNDPGGNIGGPVYIPHLYNGKDKTFFFVDFNVTLSSTGGLYTQLTPTSLEKAGDFSASRNGALPVQIFDPATAQLDTDGKTLVRTQFPGNIIPSSRIDPVAAQIVKFYPTPNGTYAGGANYSVHPPDVRDIWQYLGRIDHNFSSKDRGFFRFGQYSPNANATLRIPNKANSDTSGGWVDTQATLSETHLFSPTMINDFRFGWVQEDNYTSAGGGPAPELGLKGVALTTFPSIGVGGFIPLGSSASNHDRDRSWVFNEALTWLKGRHTVKIGGDYRRQMYNNYNPGKLSGSYSFGNIFTARTPNDSATGFAFADLLLGVPAATSLSITDYTTRQNINSAGVYIQDDFKIRRTLTLNLGLRWEYNGPYSEANNQYASFDPTVKNRTTGNLGEVVFAGRDGAPTHFTPNIYYNFLPRIGFAWNFLPNTVLRGGYGIYRLPAIGYSSFGLVTQYTAAGTFQSLDNNLTPAYTLAQGVPPISYNIDAAGRPNVPASLTRPSSSPIQLETRHRTPYNQTWQIGFQRQFKGNWVAEIDYVGTKGVKLPIGLPLNRLPPALWGAPNSQALRPFPQYLNVAYLTNNGNSFYNALQTSLQRRWASGVLSFAYTWAKVTDDVDGPAASSPIQNVYNLRTEHGIASYDVPHRLVANFVYRIPLGRGHRLLGSVPVFKDILTGWELSGITEFQMGLPLNATQNNNSGDSLGAQRPNRIGDPSLPLDQRTLTRWFNTDAFSIAPANTQGSASRFTFYGPGINNWDTSLMRNFRLRENLRLQLRGEFYNTFNHANFKNPGTSLANRNTLGVITSDNGPRIMEVAIRLFF